MFPCPSGTSFITLLQHRCVGGKIGSGLLAAPRKASIMSMYTEEQVRKEKFKKIIKALPLSPSLASKLFTKSPRLCYSVFCFVQREQVISKANQECIHYCRAAVGESNCSFHLARGLWTATIQSSWLFGKPFCIPLLSLHHPPTIPAGSAMLNSASPLKAI